MTALPQLWMGIIMYHGTRKPSQNTPHPTWLICKVKKSCIKSTRKNWFFLVELNLHYYINQLQFIHGAEVGIFINIF